MPEPEREGLDASPRHSPHARANHHLDLVRLGRSDEQRALGLVLAANVSQFVHRRALHHRLWVVVSIVCVSLCIHQFPQVPQSAGTRIGGADLDEIAGGHNQIVARPPRVRRISSPPTARSRALICLLIDGCEMASLSAAPRMLPASATAMNSSNWRVVGIGR